MSRSPGIRPMLREALLALVVIVALLCGLAHGASQASLAPAAKVAP